MNSAPIRPLPAPLSGHREECADDRDEHERLRDSQRGFADLRHVAASQPREGDTDGTVCFIRANLPYPDMELLHFLGHSEPLNAILGWVSVGVLAISIVYNLLSGVLLWAGFSATILIVVLLPPWSTGRWSVMAPWPLVSVSALAVWSGSTGFSSEIAGYVAVAALALLVAVELDAFTAVEMSRRFAVAFAVLTTLAVQGLWIIAQYYSDRWLETDFLTTQTELQVDIVLVTVVGLTMGTIFEWYFARVEHVGSHKNPTNSFRDQ